MMAGGLSFDFPRADTAVHWPFPMVVAAPRPDLEVSTAVDIERYTRSACPPCAAAEAIDWLLRGA